VTTLADRPLVTATPAASPEGIFGRALFVLVVAYLILNRAIPDVYVLPIGVSLRVDEVILAMALPAFVLTRITEPRPLPYGAVGFLGLLMIAVLTWAPFIEGPSLTQFQANGAERGLFRMFLFTGLFLSGHHISQDLKTGRKLLAWVISITAVQALLAVWEFVIQRPLAFFASFAQGIGLQLDPRGIRGETVDIETRLTGELRAVTTAPISIVLSAVIAMAVVIVVFWLIRSQNWRQRRWLGVALLALVLGLPAANSRTGFVIVAVLAAPIIFMNLKHVPRMIPVSIVGILLLGASFAVSPRTPRLLLNSLLEPGNDPNTTVRIDRFSLVPELLGQRPLFGAGFQTHDVSIQLFDNSYNLGLVEFGIVGLALVVMFLLAVANRCRHGIERSDDEQSVVVAAGLVGSLALLLGSATFDAFAFDQFLPTTILLMGIGVGQSATVMRRGAGRSSLGQATPRRDTTAPARSAHLTEAPRSRAVAAAGAIDRRAAHDGLARVVMVAYTNYLTDPRVRRSAEALAASGRFNVEVLALDWDGHTRHRVVDGVEVHGIWRSRYRGSSTARYLLAYVGFLFSAARRLTLMHLRSRIDVVHIHNMPDFMVFAAAPVKLMGAEVVLDIHDLMPELYASKFGASMSHPLVRLIEFVERLSVGFADHTFVTHALARDKIIERGGKADDVSVIHNFPDPARFPLRAAMETGKRPRGKPVQLIYHGTLAPRHGLDIAIRAVAHAHESVNVALRIIGDGDDVPRLRQMISDLDAADFIDLQVGFIPVDELLPQIIDADIGIVPILRDIGTDQMLPTKLLEYVQLGIPTICTELDTTAHFFTNDQVWFVESGNVDMLSETIEAVYSMGAVRRATAQRALRFFETYSWDIDRTHLEATIAELAGLPARASDQNTTG
jgi:glycosyltransferase involved in cell wall biosynthesis